MNEPVLTLIGECSSVYGRGEGIFAVFSDPAATAGPHGPIGSFCLLHRSSDDANEISGKTSAASSRFDRLLAALVLPSDSVIGPSPPICFRVAAVAAVAIAYEIRQMVTKSCGGKGQDQTIPVAANIMLSGCRPGLFESRHTLPDVYLRAPWVYNCRLPQGQLMTKITFLGAGSTVLARHLL